MPRDLILGTAGHIDHGKTALIRALTGIDCDRLPEEKLRGITIDIGFANLELDEFHIGIIDVPGHERFIRNMLAGATGIELALLIVAADDSVMPQTREHLDILKLLGLSHGIIVLTKIDLVDETTRDVVKLEVRDLVAGSFLEHAPIIPVSSVTGQGIAELRTALREACNRLATETRNEPFRLAIDRSFVLQGLGTIVTGSVTSGSLGLQDELEWHKNDGTSGIVRIRSLNNHGRPVELIRRGQRAAINLAGIPNDLVRRGQELASIGYLKQSKVMTVRLQALAGLTRGIKHRLPVRLHLGTAEVMATVSLLDADIIPPGGVGFAQLFLDEPVTAVWGQPCVLRDSSAEHTLGGGRILQPTAVKLRRRHLASLERIEQLASGDPQTRVRAAAWFAGALGFEANDLVRSAGIAADRVGEQLQTALTDGSLVELMLPPNRRMYLQAERLRELEERIQDTLAVLHEQYPLMTNHDRQKTLSRLEYIGDHDLLQCAVDRLIRSKVLIGDGRRIARADFKPKLSANQRKLKDKIVDDHLAAGVAPPEPASFSNLAGGNAASLKDIFEVAAAEGHLVRVGEDMYLHADVERAMRERVEARLRTQPGASVAEIRDLLGTTRKYAVPICEYLDRIGLTRRDGDLRVLAASKEENSPADFGRA